MEEKVLANQHQDYCDYGLAFEETIYKIVQANDGAFFRDIATFTNQEAFVNFLKRQPDWSLSSAYPTEELLYSEDQFC